MRTKALLSAVIAGAVVLGCASDMFRAKTHATCHNQNCEVKVLVANGHVTVDFDELEIKGNPDVHILWKLPANYQFITSMGDGIFFKRDDGGQFYDPFVTDDEAGQPSANKRSGKNFHWRDKNTVAGPYEYKIRFHDRSGNLYHKDPTIMNAT
jgi:hypothetical protein